MKNHTRVALNDGCGAGLILPHGLLLRGGDLPNTEDGSEIIEVTAAPESISMVRRIDPFLLAKAYYHLGNRRAPLQILPDELHCHHDYVLDDMLRQLNLEMTFTQLLSEPGVGAYVNESHGHYHGHTH